MYDALSCGHHETRGVGNACIEMEQVFQTFTPVSCLNAKALKRLNLICPSSSKLRRASTSGSQKQYTKYHFYGTFCFMSETVATTPRSTIFERVWQQKTGHLFHSEKHGVMAVADKFPKMPLQVVVAPATGQPGEEVHFYDLAPEKQRKLLEVGLAVGSKILDHCMPGQRSMFTLEGFAVKDHAHIVYYAGERGQGIDRYTGQVLGEEAVRQTIEAITFEPIEVKLLEARLDQIS